ncbi:uncharacterized protein LOC121738697 isoform X1 [Aricia agestis]|uniref:uncharacterized protein LOC121734132 isoform X1 n=1 Tax=Aricia agestis TaxID=91739 RepID=UPI001C202069|nr:uncharacterized protein LOC121734132 isoform X1 [Aricia agestis]XP_041984604.1 uncharacterized protein LOC121737114 isoform X1 [Aricia agestis]XP_041986849.1 uncharacterized protein LOC121738697 isoform X1 [Aricia agestis]
MTFGKSQCNVQVKCNNEIISLVNEHKFLGIVLDNKLKFNVHIDYICNKAYKRLNILRCLAGVFWGADPKILSMLYKSLVRSHFDYSCLAYINASASLLKKLDIIQNQALRIITGAMKSTPINSMEVETYIPPLFLRRLMLAKKYFVKMIAIKSSLPVRKLKVSEEITSLLDSSVITSQIISTRILPQMPTLLQLVLNMTNDIYSSDLWPIYDNFEGSLEKKYLVTTGDIYGKTDFLSFIEKKTDFYKIYTDGSKTIDEVKSAYYDEFLDVTKCFIISNMCSIYTAECYAVYMALQYIKTLSYVNNFLVISDSKSVLVALDNSNLSFKKELLEMRGRIQPLEDHQMRIIRTS